MMNEVNGAIPIGIREGLTVYISGIPYDLSEREAKKINNVITAYVKVNDPQVNPFGCSQEVLDTYKSDKKPYIEVM